MEQQYDVVVVGGGPAGLNGALALARSRRSVLVVDAGEPRNAPAAHAHNFLSRDGVPPLELLAAGRAEVASYGGELRSGRAVTAEPVDGGFAVTLADGDVVRARRLLVTTGLVDELPDVPGLREHWGRDVLHCPYCHGWEVRDQAVGVLSTGPNTLHQAQLFRQLTADVTVFAHTGPELTTEQREQLDARGIAVVEGEVVGLEVDGDALAGVRLASGEVVPRRALVVAPRFTARSELLASLGLTAEPVEMGGSVIGSAVPAAERTGATAVAGVFVAGNVTDLGAQVIGSASAGLLGGAAVNGDLVAEDVRRAVARRRTHGARPAFDQAFWDDLYGTAPRWSGRPNAQLVAEVSDLRPGTALDVGSGEGGDAIWLAQHGWRVTGTDISTVALARAAEAATAAGVEVEWVHADLTAEPLPGRYDLVSAQYVHLPEPQRRELHARLAAAVAPGGTLLLVTHEEPAGHDHTGHGWDLTGMFSTAAEEAAALDPAEWEVVVAEHRPRTTTTPDGQEVSRPDVVVRARRR